MTPPEPIRVPDARARAARIVREALLDALAVLAPVSCAGCGAGDRAVCSGCRAALVPDPAVTLIDGLEVWSGLRYESVARAVVLAVKEQGRTDAARPLGTALAAALRLVVRGEVELAPVPSSRRARRRRGYDPVRLMLRRAGQPRPAPVLAQVRRTRQQKSLDSEERVTNLRGSMRARHPLHGRSFVIVDDVLTTGATLMEAARAITEAGGRVVGAATVAATPKRVGRAFSSGSPPLRRQP